MKQKGIQKVVSVVMKKRDNKNDKRHSSFSMNGAIIGTCYFNISPPDHKDTESSQLCSDFSNLLCSELRL